MSSDNPKTLIGFDFGQKYIGYAVGQTLTRSARGLGVIRATAGVPEWQQIEQLLKQWNPQALVVGLPIDMFEQETTATIVAKRFAQKLRDRFHLPVYMIDEKLSSCEARQCLAEQGRSYVKEDIDAMAAQIILQSWLNKHLE